MKRKTGLEMMQGTLDLLVLQTLMTMGPMHGYSIARRLEQVSEDSLRLNQGTLYPALMRLTQRGWVRSDWGVSENKRRARFYRISRAGQRQLKTEREDWYRMSVLVQRVIEGAGS